MYNEIRNAVAVLKKGGTILYPTDTIWGIGCDATNEEAVSKIYKIKNREESKNLIILLNHAGRLPSYLNQVPDIAWELINIADKPLTLIYPGAKNLAKNIIAEDGSVAIRIVQNEFCIKLIESFRKPIVSTSANISDQPHPKNYNEIDEQIKTQIDYIVNFNRNNINKIKPSSILKLGINGEFQIIRK